MDWGWFAIALMGAFDMGLAWSALEYRRVRTATCEDRP